MKTNPVHQIRLNGPWGVLPPTGTLRVSVVEPDFPDVWKQVRLPAEWRDLFGEASGTAWFRRKFHKPTGLTEHEEVRILLPERVGVITELRLNQELIAAVDAFPLQFNITQHLQEFNEVVIGISFDPVAESEIPGGLWSPVLLEIHSVAD